jgi:murein DD-endopeptidase MepM/ murein hydrolase activator NlpD
MGMTVAHLRAAAPEDDLSRLLRPYSTQQIVALNVGETFTFKLKSGAERVLRLVSVQEHRDSVIHLVRRADVRVQIDARRLDLVCAPYVMPTEIAGLRIQADTTAGWGNVPKQVQFSLWDAADPIVDTRRFGFPLRRFRLFSQGTQAYNEPVHLGAGDGDPKGQRFYHDYGFDLAGFEGREEVVSATEGKVVAFWPSRKDLCSVLVRDGNGLVWEYGHLSAAAREIVLGASLTRGQKIGTLGRTGPSGNFSHLHLGTFLSLRKGAPERPNRRLNLYPWLVTAYQAAHPRGVLAVARPHQACLTGKTITLDGTNSLAFGGRRIVEWRWALPDGRTIRQARAQQQFDRPGAYVAALWVRDDQGAEDVDFCQIKAFSSSGPEKAMPHIFMTYTPTQDVRPDQPLTFRFWFQGDGAGPIEVDFGDGTRLADYKSYAEVRHGFKAPGVHVVTARCEARGKPVMQKLKVIVSRKG